MILILASYFPTRAVCSVLVGFVLHFVLYEAENKKHKFLSSEGFY